jgi:A/G-specific adenine glycosylase
MRALPTGPWTQEDPGLADAPTNVDWREVGLGRHVFTHFALEYRLVAARCRERSNGGEWWPIADIEAAGLPTVFARAARLILPEIA